MTFARLKPRPIDLWAGLYRLALDRNYICAAHHGGRPALLLLQGGRIAEITPQMKNRPRSELRRTGFFFVVRMSPTISSTKVRKSESK